MSRTRRLNNDFDVVVVVVSYLGKKKRRKKVFDMAIIHILVATRKTL